jgi:hypothetical protein
MTTNAFLVHQTVINAPHKQSVHNAQQDLLSTLSINSAKNHAQMVNTGNILAKPAQAATSLQVNVANAMIQILLLIQVQQPILVHHVLLVTSLLMEHAVSVQAIVKYVLPHQRAVLVLQDTP